MNDNNFLDYIPVPAEDVEYEIIDGKVTILMKNKGFFNAVAQKVFNKPEVSRIDLDEMGNFIWPLMDGKRDIFAISEFIKEKYGEKAEPLYPRAVQYFKTLAAYGFIKYVTDSESKQS